MATMLVVPVVKIGNVRLHPNASMLGLAQVLGYQVVVGLVEDPNGPIVRHFLKDKRDEKGKRIPVLVHAKFLESGEPSVVKPYIEFDPNGHGCTRWFWTEDKDGNKTTVDQADVETIRFSFRYNEGDLVVYVPGDSILTDEWATKLDIKSLLKGGNRVAKIALRGEPSFGLVIEVPEDKKGVWQEGDNVAEYFEITKYEPPVKTNCGDASPRDADIDPYFDKFTDIQNLRIFVHIFAAGEEVVASEKLHGTCCRTGIINGHRVAGSMELRRSPPKDGDFSKSTYWFPWSLSSVVALLDELSKTNPVVELFGEVYGNSIQKGFKYDAGNGIGFRSFGIKVGDKFLDWQDFENACVKFGVPMVPVLYKGPFDMAKILALAEGKTTIGDAPLIEGVVVVPVKERCDPKIGRVTLKVVGIGYDLLKNKPDCKDV